MRQLLNWLHKTIGNDLGFPITLRKTLATLPAVPTPVERVHSVDFDRIVGWHDWGTWKCNTHNEGKGGVRGWRQTYHGYDSIDIPLLENFGQTQVIDTWHCDIQDVYGLGASKSKLSDFTDLDQFIQASSPQLIQDIDQQGLEKNLAHDEIRILHKENPIDYFACHRWDGRVYLLNEGGSHHFSAARYIAKRIGMKVPLKGKYCEHLLNDDAVQNVLRDYDVYAIPHDWPAHPHPSFHDLMKASSTTYYWKILPKPLHEFQAIFLPKAERRSVRVSQALRGAAIYDLGAHLINLLQRQRSFIRG